VVTSASSPWLPLPPSQAAKNLQTPTCCNSTWINPSLLDGILAPRPFSLCSSENIRGKVLGVVAKLLAVSARLRVLVVCRRSCNFIPMYSIWWGAEAMGTLLFCLVTFCLVCKGVKGIASSPFLPWNLSVNRLY
jgi:hypothetical protein